MGIQSMTGFGRATGEAPGFQWTWEIKSVNSRGLDTRVRVPSLFDGLDIQARQLVAGRLQRGNVSASLSLRREAGEEVVKVNEAALQKLLDFSRDLSGEEKPDTAAVAALLALNGLVEIRAADLSEGEIESLKGIFLKGLESAIDRLIEAREAEGRKLAVILTGQLDELAANVVAAEATESTSPDAIRARLQEKIAGLTEGDVNIDQDRLAQEVALMAVKADVREEIDRLNAHIEGARELLEKDGAIGRQLDFLSQELNREANTICSKSSDMILTRIGLEMKSGVDRFREQVQNIE